MPWAYHEGERAVQRRAGVVAQADRNARVVVTEIPDLARDFLAEQPFVVVGSADDGERVWCSVLSGPPGFLRAPDEHTVEIDATPAPDDPLALVPDGAEVGLLAIQPPTRRRMRVNGPMWRTPTGTLAVRADEVISNCPRFITRREVGVLAPAVSSSRSTRLTPTQREWLTGTDTFFVATAAPGGGVDASHRGGEPGFVRVDGADRLVWPDYSGNAMFLTLGNLELNPAAGVLVVDWESGSTLQLTGRAVVEWRGADDRSIVFDVEEVREART